MLCHCSLSCTLVNTAVGLIMGHDVLARRVTPSTAPAPVPSVSAVLVFGLLRVLQVIRALGVVTGAGAPHRHEDSESLVPSFHGRGHGLLADRAGKRSLGTGLMLGFTHPLIIGTAAVEGERGTRAVMSQPAGRWACSPYGCGSAGTPPSGAGTSCSSPLLRPPGASHTSRGPSTSHSRTRSGGNRHSVETPDDDFLQRVPLHCVGSPARHEGVRRRHHAQSAPAGTAV